jgi:NAD(P)-dependent dehydrogenase (short-subunit alcohol dehydrogenase family)
VGAFLFGVRTSMYASGKGGLLTMTRYMAAEFAPRGIRVNALAPGSVDTDMVRNNPPEAVERMAAASLMGRLAAPEEMVGPVLFLASDAASYMTGQVLVVDGGLAAY